MCHPLVVGVALPARNLALAEAQGWHAQSTSVPGVAQRTGATIYYLELLAGHRGLPPALSLSLQAHGQAVSSRLLWMNPSGHRSRLHACIAVLRACA